MTSGDDEKRSMVGDWLELHFEGVLDFESDVNVYEWPDVELTALGEPKLTSGDLVLDSLPALRFDARFGVDFQPEIKEGWLSDLFGVRLALNRKL